jgi:hypothetical protein
LLSAALFEAKCGVLFASLFYISAVQHDSNEQNRDHLSVF